MCVFIEHENGGKTFFNVRYVENNSTLKAYETHFKSIGDAITSSKANDSFVLMGDYNLADSVTWCSVDNSNICAAKDIKTQIPHELLNLQAMCNLNQFNRVRNSINRTIDLCLSDIESNKLHLMRSPESLVTEDQIFS